MRPSPLALLTPPARGSISIPSAPALPEPSDEQILDELLALPESVPPETPLPFSILPQSFIIDSMSRATWAARKVAAAQDRVRQREEFALALKARVDHWLASSCSHDEDSITYLSSLLRPWAEAEIARQGRRRSIDLLGVTIGLRLRPARVEVHPEHQDEALAYCRENLKEAVNVSYSLSKTALKERLAKGQVIPGVALVPGTDEFYVKSNL